MTGVIDSVASGRRARRRDLWSPATAVALGLLLVAAHGHAELVRESGQFIFCGAIVVVSIPVVRRVRAFPARRVAWGLLLGAEALTAFAGLLYGRLPGGTNPFAAPLANMVLAVATSACAVGFVLSLAYASLRVLDLTLRIDAMAGGLALASVVCWLYLQRIMGSVSSALVGLSRPAHVVVGVALVTMVIIAFAAVAMVDVTRDYLMVNVALAALVISIGELVASYDIYHRARHWGVVIDLCWIVAYALAGRAAARDDGAVSARGLRRERAFGQTESRKVGVVGVIALAISALSSLYHDPIVVGGLALGAIFVLLVRLLVSLRGERVHSGTLEALATTDALTGLANRRALSGVVLTDVGAPAPRAGGIVLIDLDNFKEVNDSLGHRAGDVALTQLSHRLERAVGDEAVLARLGGDEFAAFVPRATRDELTSLARRMEGLIREPVRVEGLSLHLSASLGVALHTSGTDSMDELIRKADVAMYLAKGNRSGVEVYDYEHDRNDPGRLVLFGLVSQAVRERGIDVHLQPIIDVAANAIVGCEALARWCPDGYGPVPPDRFVPMIELQGLMIPFTEHVLREAIAHVKRLDLTDVFDTRHRLSVNVTERDFVNGDFPALLEEILDDVDFAHDRLTIEITEGILANDNTRVGQCIETLRERGVRISVDDFGTGYSALSKLIDFTVDEVKIDRAFTSQVLSNEKAKAVVRAAVELGREMHLDVVAEGVETSETYDALSELGVNLVQGFLIARPMPIDECHAFLSAHVGAGASPRTARA